VTLHFCRLKARQYYGVMCSHACADAVVSSCAAVPAAAAALCCCVGRCQCRAAAGYLDLSMSPGCPPLLLQACLIRAACCLCHLHQPQQRPAIAGVLLQVLQTRQTTQHVGCAAGYSLMPSLQAEAASLHRQHTQQSTQKGPLGLTGAWQRSCASTLQQTEPRQSLTHAPVCTLLPPQSAARQSAGPSLGTDGGAGGPCMCDNRYNWTQHLEGQGRQQPAVRHSECTDVFQQHCPEHVPGEPPSQCNMGVTTLTLSALHGDVHLCATPKTWFLSRPPSHGCRVSVCTALHCTRSTLSTHRGGSMYPRLSSRATASPSASTAAAVLLCSSASLQGTATKGSHTAQGVSNWCDCNPQALCWHIHGSNRCSPKHLPTNVQCASTNSRHQSSCRHAGWVH
jgi:hypothetical protein